MVDQALTLAGVVVVVLVLGFLPQLLVAPLVWAWMEFWDRRS